MKLVLSVMVSEAKLILTNLENLFQKSWAKGFAVQLNFLGCCGTKRRPLRDEIHNWVWWINNVTRMTNMYLKQIWCLNFKSNTFEVHITNFQESRSTGEKRKTCRQSNHLVSFICQQWNPKWEVDRPISLFFDHLKILDRTASLFSFLHLAEHKSFKKVS